MRVAAQSRSASDDQSGQTTAAALPPSSSVTCLCGTAFWIAKPTASEPVKDTIGMRSSATSAGATSLPTGRTDHEPAGQVGLGEQLAEQQRRQRRGRCRLHDDGGTDGDRRRDLVRHEVEREVERRDAQDRPVGEAAHDRGAPGAGALGVEALHVAARPAHLLGGETEHARRAARLRARPQQRLAVLRGDQLGDLVEPLGDAPRDVHEGLGAHRHRRGGELVADRPGGGHRLLDLLGGGHGVRAHDGAVEGVGHLDGDLGGRGAAGDPGGAHVSHGEDGTASPAATGRRSGHRRRPPAPVWTVTTTVTRTAEHVGTA